jgi:trans-aconitate methyltransferase
MTIWKNEQETGMNSLQKICNWVQSQGKKFILAHEKINAHENYMKHYT